MQLLGQVFEYISLAIGILGSIIVMWGIVLGFIEFLRSRTILFSRSRNPLSLEIIRTDLGRYLLLGLEFFIAADIIHTIIKPSLEEVAVLLAIVAIRTVISYFLNKEVERIAQSNQVTEIK